MTPRLAVILCALVALPFAAPAADTAAAASTQHKIGVVKTGNRTKANRPKRAIRLAVVHVTEGSFAGSVRWLLSPASVGSAHFIVSKKGEVIQMVSTSDVAWHAGNKWVNAASVGIEHEGFTARGGFTKAQYEASARLLAYLSKRTGIQLDRRHVIGHDEVPHPYRAGVVGGVDGHTDPGAHWDWNRYMALAREYAAQEIDELAPKFVKVAPPVPVAAPAAKVVEKRFRCGYHRSVHSTTVYDGQTIAGLVPWRAQGCGRRIHRVDFIVDGKVVWQDKVKPFAFARGRNLNTTHLVNGWHTLTLRAYWPGGHRVRNRIRVKVENPPFAVGTLGVSNGQAVSGELSFTADPNVPAKRVELRLGDEVVTTSDAAPHELTWDTTAVANGTHELELRAEAVDGRSTTETLSVLVANVEPTTEPAPRVAWHSLSQWQTLEGSVVWNALVEGEVEQVEFWVDGRLRSTATAEPYSFGGAEGLWDTSAERAGPHHVTVRAVGPGGRVAEAHATVFVSNEG